MKVFRKHGIDWALLRRKEHATNDAMVVRRDAIVATWADDSGRTTILVEGVAFVVNETLEAMTKCMTDNRQEQAESAELK